MPVDVQDAIHTVCVKCGGMSESEAQNYLTTLITSHRLQLETWR